jgi:hypothetical protein
MAPHFLSPLVQVMHTPSLVISVWHMPMVRLHWQMAMPLEVQQQLHMPSAIMRQRFCSVAHATSSSHEQWILNPPAHFSNSYLQRGNTAQLAVPGAVAAPAACQGAAAPNAVPAVRSVIIVLDILHSFLLSGPANAIRQRPTNLGQKSVASDQFQFLKIRALGALPRSTNRPASIALPSPVELASVATARI